MPHRQRQERLRRRLCHPQGRSAAKEGEAFDKGGFLSDNGSVCARKKKTQITENSQPDSRWAKWTVLLGPPKGAPGGGREDGAQSMVCTKQKISKQSTCAKLRWTELHPVWDEGLAGCKRRLATVSSIAGLSINLGHQY